MCGIPHSTCSRGFQCEVHRLSGRFEIRRGVESPVDGVSVMEVSCDLQTLTGKSCLGGSPISSSERTIVKTSTLSDCVPILNDELSKLMVSSPGSYSDVVTVVVFDLTPDVFFTQSTGPSSPSSV